MLSHTAQGWLHFMAAAIALLLGAVQLLRPKGSTVHRRLGYAYIVVLLACDFGALSVYQFNGRFNALHVGAILSALCVVAGVVPFYVSPRPQRWRVHHAMWICWSYIGIWAAGLTELTVPTVHWSSRSQVIGATVAVTATVTCIGWLLMNRLRFQLLRHEARTAT